MGLYIAMLAYTDLQHYSRPPHVITISPPAVILILNYVPSKNFFFFFQAEDGIRDLIVTGVQTCALPIWLAGGHQDERLDRASRADPAGPPGDLRAVSHPRLAARARHRRSASRDRDGHAPGPEARRQDLSRLRAKRARTPARRAVQCAPTPRRPRLDAARVAGGRAEARHPRVHDPQRAGAHEEAQGRPAVAGARPPARPDGRAGPAARPSRPIACRLRPSCASGSARPPVTFPRSWYVRPTPVSCMCSPTVRGPGCGIRSWRRSRSGWRSRESPPCGTSSPTWSSGRDAPIRPPWRRPRFAPR